MGKAYVGGPNTNITLTAASDNTYNITHINRSNSVITLWECSTTLVDTFNACRNLTRVTTNVLANTTDGSYFLNTTTNRLLINPTGALVLNSSTYDYHLVENVTAPVIQLNLGGDYVVFDGGPSRFLRFSYGNPTFNNGIFSTESPDSLVFRNLEMLYGAETGHLWHTRTKRLLFYNTIFGKSSDNQAMTHSLIDGDYYGWIINNTIIENEYY
jgi:hypothetical protein